MKENRQGPVTLGVMLGGLAAGKEWRARLAQHRIFLIWAEVVGEELAEVCRPEVIRDSVLWVRVVDPVWGQQLQFEKRELLAAVNRRLAAARPITDLRFRFDPSLAREPDPARSPVAPPRSPVAIDPAREAEFGRLIAGLDDSQARANLLRLWRKAEAAGGPGEEDR